MKEHDTATLVASQAFKAINHLIDQTADSLVGYHQLIDERMLELLRRSDSQATVTVRTSYEGRGRVQPLRFDIHELGRLVETIEEVARKEELINQLTRYKLRLLNDPDFTRSLNDQLAVFGLGKDIEATSAVAEAVTYAVVAISKEDPPHHSPQSETFLSLTAAAQHLISCSASGNRYWFFHLVSSDYKET